MKDRILDMLFAIGIGCILIVFIGIALMYM